MDFEKQAKEVAEQFKLKQGLGMFEGARYEIEQALRQSYAQGIEDAANCAKHLSGWGNGKRASHEHAEHIEKCIRSLNKEGK